MRTRRRRAVKVKDYTLKKGFKTRFQSVKEWIEKSLEKNGAYTYTSFEE